MTKQEKGFRLVHRGDDTSRIIGLSDGLFATALTVLVLELNIPELASAVGDADVLRSLVDMYPKLFSYLLTFLVTGAYWMAHHWDFGHIVRYNGRLLWLNLMFLLCVGLLPLTTAMLGDHDNGLIWTVYAINMVGIGLMLTAVWSYAATHKLIHPQVEPEVVRYVTLRHLVTPGVFLFSIGLVALSGREIGSYAPLLIPFVYTLLGRFSPGARPGSESEGEDEERESAMRGLFWQIVTLLPLIAFVAWALWVRLIYK